MNRHFAFDVHTLDLWRADSVVEKSLLRCIFKLQPSIDCARSRFSTACLSANPPFLMIETIVHE